MISDKSNEEDFYYYNMYMRGDGASAKDRTMKPCANCKWQSLSITNLYVDKVDEDKLVEEAIIKMLAQLDPHSTYNNAEEVKKMNEPLQGNFEGIGVQFQMIEDTLLVIQPVSNGPSEKVGILAGDRIVAVNDSAIAGVKMSTEDIMSRLRGPKDSEVNSYTSCALAWTTSCTSP